jgi:hypothetical protein
MSATSLLRSGRPAASPQGPSGFPRRSLVRQRERWTRGHDGHRPCIPLDEEKKEGFGPLGTSYLPLPAILQLPCPSCPRVQPAREASRCGSARPPFHTWGHCVHRSSSNANDSEKRKSPCLSGTGPATFHLEVEGKEAGRLPCSPSTPPVTLVCLALPSQAFAVLQLKQERKGKVVQSAASDPRHMFQL